MNLVTNGIIIKKLYIRKQSMTPTNLNVIRRTWSLAALNKMQVTLIFYANLFQIAPDTEVLFKNDLTSQATKLMDTLTFIVDHLDEPETLLPAARDLSIRHVDYGVTEDHYAFVKRALLLTFADLLGPDFGPKEHAAWSQTYDELASHMIVAARDAKMEKS